MQRLLGTFPNRSAGVALLILRLAVAAALISSARLCPGPESEVVLALSRIAAVLIIVGWYMRLAAISAVAVSLCTFWVCSEPVVDAWRINALIIAILVAIGLLGAGAYSVDARLYGRRRLVVGRPRSELERRETP
jgi:TQO small subunit DoxD